MTSSSGPRSFMEDAVLPDTALPLNKGAHWFAYGSGLGARLDTAGEGADRSVLAGDNASKE